MINTNKHGSVIGVIVYVIIFMIFSFLIGFQLGLSKKVTDVNLDIISSMLQGKKYHIDEISEFDMPERVFVDSLMERIVVKTMANNYNKYVLDTKRFIVIRVVN